MVNYSQGQKASTSYSCRSLSTKSQYRSLRFLVTMLILFAVFQYKHFGKRKFKNHKEMYCTCSYSRSYSDSKASLCSSILRVFGNTSIFVGFQKLYEIRQTHQLSTGTVTFAHGYLYQLLYLHSFYCHTSNACFGETI